MEREVYPFRRQVVNIRIGRERRLWVTAVVFLFVSFVLPGFAFTGGQEAQKVQEPQKVEAVPEKKEVKAEVPLQQQYRNTISDLRVLSQAIDDYIWDKKKAPPVKDIVELLSHDMGMGLSFVEFYMDEYPEDKIPTTDAWGNQFVYKFKGERYWLGSGGSNGKFFRFDQQGAYRYNDKEMADKDVIFSNGGMVFGPVADHKYKEMGRLSVTLAFILLLFF
jgi:hypothetical protein